MCNLDSNSPGVYLQLNLIEARAAAILTPHLMRHAPAVFWSLSGSLMFVIHSYDQCWQERLGANKLLDKSLLSAVETRLAASQAVDRPFLGTKQRLKPG